MGFVCPQLEYGSTIWDPGVQNNGAYRVKMVQRRAARWTLKRYHNTSSVTDMLDDLGWRTLEQRRADTRLALLFKIYNGLITVNAREYLRHPTQRSQHSHSYSFIPLSILPVPPLIISHSTLEQSLSGTVCLSLCLRTLIWIGFSLQASCLAPVHLWVKIDTCEGLAIVLPFFDRTNS